MVYPKPTIPGLRDRDAGIRHALEHPEEADPLKAQLRPGMKVTIAIDDISLPLPKMNRPRRAGIDPHPGARPARGRGRS